MMYIFPREFGLHNVFTSSIDRRETSQALKDYTLREDEIKLLGPSVKIPKRLRGKATKLIERLQINHGRCPYSELLRHYCPIEVGFVQRIVAYHSNNQGHSIPPVTGYSALFIGFRNPDCSL
jgi:hypothetical protein